MPNDEDINNLAYEVAFAMIRALASEEMHKKIAEYIKKIVEEEIANGKF